MFRSYFFECYSTKNIDNEAKEAIELFHDKYQETYRNFAFLSLGATVFEEDTNSEQDESLKTANFLLNFFRSFGDNRLDPSLDNFNNNYKAILKGAYLLVDFYKKEQLIYGEDCLEGAFISKKSNFKINSKYNYDVAFDILNNDIKPYNLWKFLKVVLLSEDYYNANKIFDIRNYVLSSNEIDKNILGLFSNETINKDILSMFFADYRLLQYIIDFSQKQFELPINFEYKIDEIMLFIYCRFILDMYIFIFEVNKFRPLIRPKEKRFLKILTQNIKIDIIFSKIYNRIDLLLYALSYPWMTIFERWYFIIKRLLDDACIHEAANLGPSFLEDFIKYKSGIESTLRSIENDPLIEKMSKIIEQEWLNGSKLNHIQMMNKLFHKKKYHDILLEKVVHDKLAEKLKQICDKRGFKLIWGKHPGLHRVKDEILAEINKIKITKK